MISLFLFAAASPAEPVQKPATAAMQRKIILFGARWCAPCMGEYRALDALVDAARAQPILLAWTDRPIAPPATLPRGRVDTMALDEARKLALRIGGEGYGLPLAAMFEGDRLCAVWKAPLRPADLARLHAQCDAAGGNRAD